jgi:lipoate-protein ligase A
VLSGKNGWSGGGWALSREDGPAAELHRRSAAVLNDIPVRRSVRILHADAPTLVLGSHQDEAVFDPAALAAAGVTLARRRSGGSAVLVGPGRVLWVDFLVGAGDPLWCDDVGRAAWWVGELWAAAIGSGAEVWRHGMRRSAWSPVVCFAGLAPGEVTIGGRKVVGVCQRRTPRAALFQTAAVIDWQPDEYGRLVRSPPGPAADLEATATGLGDAAALDQALVEHLMP